MKARFFKKSRTGPLAVLIGSAIALATSLTAGVARADVSGDLESLGGNKAVTDRANRLSSGSQSQVVQGRNVDLNNRIEIAGSYGPVAMGNSYLFTQNLGVQVDYHIVPQFSLGVRYEQAQNTLTNEGQAAMDAASKQKKATGSFTSYPDIDYPDHTILGMATWYMFYGKMNFFDLRVIQFDVYTLAGAGQTTTAQTVSPTYTAGGGIAFWLAQHVSSRFEIRYQTYKDKPYTGERDLNVIIGNVALGVLL